VENKEDLRRLAEGAHHIFNPHHPAMRSRHVAALYA
jgi:hypothetical protein